MADITDPEGLAESLRAARHAAGMTQWDLSVAIGLRQIVSLSRYENGRSLPSPEGLSKMIEVLGMDADATWNAWGLAYAARARKRLQAGK